MLGACLAGQENGGFDGIAALRKVASSSILWSSGYVCLGNFVSQRGLRRRGSQRRRFARVRNAPQRTRRSQSGAGGKPVLSRKGRSRKAWTTGRPTRISQRGR